MIERCDTAENRVSQSSEGIPEGDRPLCDDVTIVTGGLRTSREIACFNAGVRVALSHALQAADAIEAMPAFTVTRAGFAVEALRELAAAGEALLLLPAVIQKDDARG